MSWFWLSFVDPSKSAPREEQVSGGGGFLGLCLVEGEDALAAVTRAHVLGINPGGEVAVYELEGVVRDSFRDRLIKRDEAMVVAELEMDEVMETPS